MKSCAVPLPPAQDVTNPFVQHLHTVHASCLLVTEQLSSSDLLLQHCRACVQVTVILLNVKEYFTKVKE